MNEKNWLQSINAINVYKQLFIQSKQTYHTDIDMQGIDANRAFVLYCCSMINKCILQKDTTKALEYAQIACYDTLQAIEENDNHFK